MVVNGISNKNSRRSFHAFCRRYGALYVMAFPILLYYFIFHYIPMFGVVISFQDFRVTRGFLDSDWVGLWQFDRFFGSMYAWTNIRNTLSISILSLVFAFPAPILLALLINELKSKRFQKTVQTITYLPHFISLVIICSLVRDMFSTNGLFNEIILALGGERILFLTQPEWFYPIYIGSGIWQNIGWDSIIYFSALSAIDQDLYEAATVDGCGRFGKMWHVTLPGIAPTIVILLILRIGSIMSVGYEKIILLYSPAVYETADVISTFVYRKGIIDGDYSFAAAVDLMNAVINSVLLLVSNSISKRFGQSGLF